MGQPLLMYLFPRLLAAVDNGMTCQMAAVRFGVAPAKAIRWQSQHRDTRSFSPKRQGGDGRLRRVEDWRFSILAVWEERKDVSPKELRQSLVGVGPDVSGVAPMKQRVSFR